MKRSQLAGIEAGVSLSIRRRLRPVGAVLMAVQLATFPLAEGPRRRQASRGDGVGCGADHDATRN